MDLFPAGKNLSLSGKGYSPEELTLSPPEKDLSFRGNTLSLRENNLFQVKKGYSLGNLNLSPVAKGLSPAAKGLSPERKDLSLAGYNLCQTGYMLCLTKKGRYSEKVTLAFACRVDVYLLTLCMAKQEAGLLFDKRIFWDVDVDRLDIDKRAAFVIERVFERGDVEDIRNCRRYYGDEKVKNVLLTTKFLPEHRLHLASAVTNTPVQSFRFYTLKQLNPGLSPY